MRALGADCTSATGSSAPQLGDDDVECGAWSSAAAAAAEDAEEEEEEEEEEGEVPSKCTSREGVPHAMDWSPVVATVLEPSEIMTEGEGWRRVRLRRYSFHRLTECGWH